MSHSSTSTSSNVKVSAGLPAPLTLPACDLSDFQYMELDVRRLRDSKFAAAAEGEAFRAGILLWCAAWHQVPAASLPDDDVELANLAGYGRVLKEWKKVRAAALHGFVKCADGRLYHPVVAEKAIAAFAAKEKYAYEKYCDRLRKENAKRAKEGKPALGVPPQALWKTGAYPHGMVPQGDGCGPEQGDCFPPEILHPSAGNPPETGLKGNRKERSRERDGEGDGTDLFGGDSSPVAGATGGAASASGQGSTQGPAPASRGGGAGAGLPPEGPADGLTRDALWSAGKSLLQQAGMPRAQCGSFVGRLCKDYGSDIVAEAVRVACVARPADPAQYLKAVCMRAAGQRSGGGAAGMHMPGMLHAPANRQEALEQRNRSVADAWAAEAPGLSEVLDHPPTHGKEPPHAAL
ncbi:hypothetical protein PMI14_02229 [Acidovorax sp. CF316]|uniref:DUF1376 domain-containing protein n=1 Tax=Acidovorax sp. CF316 TaxID=1144317 RepID=UPI00026BC703|nr:DUF1376 domain-containing protein [Acidovorax sp. CF316]EJE53155.1 hypothetical protein PMI14_02229 [Acidovorax sp. CF316]